MREAAELGGKKGLMPLQRGQEQSATRCRTCQLVHSAGRPPVASSLWASFFWWQRDCSVRVLLCPHQGQQSFTFVILLALPHAAADLTHPSLHLAEQQHPLSQVTSTSNTTLLPFRYSNITQGGGKEGICCCLKHARQPSEVLMSQR